MSYSNISMGELDNESSNISQAVRQTGVEPGMIGADMLIGHDVRNHHDEHLGTIKEIMLDMRTGKIAYAVLAFGGILGIGEKLFAVPWQRLHLDTAGQHFVVDIDKSRLQSAPGFNKETWPDPGAQPSTDQRLPYFV